MVFKTTHILTLTKWWGVVFIRILCISLLRKKKYVYRANPFSKKIKQKSLTHIRKCSFYKLYSFIFWCFRKQMMNNRNSISLRSFVKWKHIEFQLNWSDEQFRSNRLSILYFYTMNNNFRYFRSSFPTLFCFHSIFFNVRFTLYFFFLERVLWAGADFMAVKIWNEHSSSLSFLF